MRIRSALYSTARLMGDANAVLKGKVFQRLLTKAFWRIVARIKPRGL
jgi:hypothetical protein